MSLTVKINQFHLGKPKTNLIARVEFRGVGHSISELSGTSDVIDVNQSYIWPLARSATPEETITVELRCQTTKILLKTGLTSPSTSRGAISSSSKFIGRYVLLMQAVMAEGKIRVEDHLVDVNNKPIQAIINFDATYKSPDDEDGNFEPTNLVNVIVQQNTAASGMDDDQQMLLDIEQNIANLEKSLQKGSSSGSSGKRKKRHHLLKNVLSSGSFSNRPSSSSSLVPGQEMQSLNKSDLSKCIKSAPVAATSSTSTEKRVTLRTVKNFIKMRKQKSASRDSSTDDDNRSLMSDLDGNSSAAENNLGDETDDGHQLLVSDSHVATEEESETSGPSSGGEEQEDIHDAIKSNKRFKSLGRKNDHLKSQDFQVCVTIIEARQLPGLNMDPVVCIQIGDQKKYTSVKESTNCPYYNEYFVFDFHMPPVLLFDKIITLSVLQSRSVLRPNKMIGTFKLDLATVWNQTDHQFYHKWALLTDPEDFISGPKGYLKCDIGIIGKGDTVKIPPKSEKDPDDIEANLLLPDGVPIERQRAKFIVKIYRADGLPRMNSSIMANVKRAFTGETKDLVSPYVQVSFAGLTGKSSVKKNSYAPVWNEQLVFTEMFPPLCQRIKIQLRDDNPVKPSIIGTHYIDLKQISNDGEKGFLPTFGPSFIHLYGSTRDYSLLDQHSNLNTGLGEGVSYRARLLIAIRTEITDNVEILPEKNVELEQTFPISETSYSKNEEFFLFSTIFEASMLDKKLHDKQVYFELSMGNAGNSLDGHNESHTIITGEEGEELDAIDVTTFNSTTNSCKPISHDKSHYFLPYWDYKQCTHVRCTFPDLRRRMYNSNMIAKIAEKFEEGLLETHQALERDDPISEDPQVKLRGCLEELAVNCTKYVNISRNAIITGHGSGKTKLDKERIKLCIREMETLGNTSRNLRALVTKSSMRERYKTAQNYSQKMKFLIDDPQHALPDIFVWLIANGKRIAYHRLDARDILYSEEQEEAGTYCGKVQTIFLKLPGKRSMGPHGWNVQGKLSIYFWLGLIKEKRHFFDTLPHGYELSQELRNADRPRAMAPTTIHYLEKHVFQMRAHIYQARSLIGSDASGLSDPYATVFITEFSKTTQVIEETLSPTWDELLVFDEILLYGTKEELKRNPPTIVIEIYDQDKVGKSEFIGRAIAKPRTKLKDNSYVTPTLEWYDIHRGSDSAGELLAAFELLELGSHDLPSLSEPKITDLPEVRVTVDRSAPPPMTLYPVPREVRPNLSRFRIEVLFWGLRDLKRVHLMSVDKPRIDVECSGKILSSNIIQNAKRNPNFSNMLKFFDLELPVEEIYAPPIVFRCVDCRSFGRYTLVGTHQISSVHRYMHRPPPKEEIKVAYKTIGGQIILSKPETEQSFNGRVTNNGSPDNLTLYGAACVTKTMHKKSSSVKRKQLPSQESSEMDGGVDNENSKDWWTKYFLSYERVIRQTKGPAPKLKSILKPEEEKKSTSLSTKGTKLITKISPKHQVMHKQDSKEDEYNPLTTPLCEIYSTELETQLEYNEFKDWLQTFPLYRGKKTTENSEDENRIVGYFKGAVKVYKLPIEKGIEPAFAPSLPMNDPIHVLVRVYIVKGTDLHPMDLNGKADPYVVLQMGGKRISDKENYVSKQLNPIFGKCFEMELKFPQDSQLTVQIYDWDLVGSDELIGETRIDLENRFYSKHRATCGLAYKYEDSGYNTWRDPMKPTQILQKLCKDNKLEAPHYFQDHVVIGKYCMTFSDAEVLAWNGPATCKNRDEHLALGVLHRWDEIPKVGCKIVPEHIESRPLYNPDKPGIEQGKIEMWVDMFPMDMPLPPPPVDISPRKPKSYELRVVIWNTDDVVLEDDAFFTGEKMSDIYVKGWVKGPQDIQSTDIHYRSLTGEGNFNWRFIFPFEYLAAEERIVLSRRESLFSWDETEVKIPARLELQVWDADHFSADDFLGAISLNLNRFPRGAKTAKLCSLDMLKTDNVPTVNIFKQKRVRGWWPFFVKKENEEMELTGKVEAEIHLLTKEEAEKNPAGYGRNEPDTLEKPNRPDASFMWFLNPLKSIRYIIWHNYKWTIIKGLIIFGLAVMLLLFFYSVPGYSVKKMMGV